MHSNSDDKDRAEWKIDFDSLTGGPDRTLNPNISDLVRPASTKDLAAVVYSILEYGMGRERGYFALFEGPPDSPKLLWQPEWLPCTGYLNVIQWIDDDRYVVVHACLTDDSRKWIEFPFVFVDVEQQQFAYFSFTFACIAYIESTGSGWIIREDTKDPRFPSRDGEQIDPLALKWLPWSQINQLRSLYWKEVNEAAGRNVKKTWFRKLIGSIFKS
tara:strand:- start:106513 stop:107157 length:645 start_codon:yes stop_codon:yes gene_type:complete